MQTVPGKHEDTTSKKLRLALEIISMGHYCTTNTCVRKEETKSSKRSCASGHSSLLEGYGAMELFRKAKEEGLQIAVQWQAANSTASSRVSQKQKS